MQLQVNVSGQDEEGNREISIHSRPQGDGEESVEWTTHASGTLSAEAKASPEPLTTWPPEGAEPISLGDVYEHFADAGLNYGPAFQGLTAAWRAGEEIYAEIVLPESRREEAGRFAIHPALLDAALHAAALTTAGQDQEQGVGLPFSWGEVSLDAQGAAELRVRLGKEEDSICLDLHDQGGMSLARVGALRTRPISAEQMAGARQKQDGLLAVQWREAELPAADASANGNAPALATIGEVELPGVERFASIAALSEAITDGAPAPKVVLCQSQPETSRQSAEAARRATKDALGLAREWISAGDLATTRLVVLTEGAVCAGEGESPDPAAAARWGLIRSAATEHPGRFALIDSDGSEASKEALGQALVQDAESQLALREGEALCPRLSREVASDGELVPPPGPWRLEATRRGTLESLALIPHLGANEPLGPTEVRIAVRASGLNFRDVLIALGVYPGEESMGSEGAGVVVEIGSEISDIAPGDRVMGMIFGSFGPLAITGRDFIAPIPADWSFEQAAALPIAFLTAHYGLVDRAGLKAGEKVLVHAGAGGVGMAAIQIAQHIGAEVFATASPSKWDALREMGIAEDHIASSRELDFKDKFLQVTDGEGVDVVLNALAGEFIEASLDLLPRGGRFVEMGKTDIRDPEQVAAAHAGVAYCAFDMLEAGAERIGQMLAEILGLFEREALRHPPISSFDMRRAPEAFRLLREGGNVGKLVLGIPQPIDPDKTVLVTGGTGGLGALIARHLVNVHGARHLLLVSRSGLGAKGAGELEAELTGLGAAVTIAACDVSDAEQMKALLEGVPGEHSLGAVVHAAGVVGDATIESITAEQIERVFSPKVDAAWHLHELTKDRDLSTFLMFSSAAGVLGAPGQGSYAAANSFLDALAQRRQSEGLPASSVAWSLWATTEGMAAGLTEADLARGRRSGIGALSEEQGLGLFDAALAAEPALSLALDLNFSGLRSMAQAGTLPAILAGLVRVPARRASAGSLIDKLAGLPEAEHGQAVLEVVRGEVAAVLGQGSAGEVDPSKAFKDLGFDSLAAVELRNRLAASTGMALQPTLVFDYPTTAGLAEHLLAEALQSGAAKQVAVRATTTDEPIAIVGVSARFPGGAGSPEGLWELVASGSDAISEFPEDRGWDLERLYDPDPDSFGTAYTREGGFIEDAAGFDAEFFGVSPREALAMDPEQRLLLEACWQALEDAGIDPQRLHGSQAGVFAGGGRSDYGGIEAARGGYGLTGTLGSVLSGRVAYALGLEGPAMTVDTACSSSLVAMHLAMQALRGGECSLALAGGVTVLSSAGILTEFSRQRGLAPDGRSKSFAESADGVGWGEGVGVLALQRLSDAQREGNQVLALLKGSAVNQDGASNG
ncbi:MAG TPA: SDR family NAD(P)-dependent oxidoreductase, partial [Solirubrobacterales bacterium]